MGEQQKDFQEQLDIRFKGLEDSTKALNDAIEKGASKDEVQGLIDQMKEQGSLLEALEQKFNSGKAEKQTLPEEIKEKLEAIKSLPTANKSKEVVLKADTNRASITGNQQAHELNTIGQLGHAQLTAYDVFPKIPIKESNNNGVIRYYDWDEATTVRAAAMVAEGAVFPESTAKWATYTIPLRKIGDTLPVTEEFYEDEAMFAAELNMFLEANVKIKREDQIINGDNTGENLKGIFASVPEYTAVASGITDASIYDLIPVVSSDITISRGSKYTPNFAFMNKADILKMQLKKDGNNNYVIPPFVDRNGEVVDGILVIENNTVAANTMVLGDSRFARIYEKTGISLSRGYVDAQFVEDMETIKVRQRLLFLIRNVDATGFRKVLDIDAALTTLASVAP